MICLLPQGTPPQHSSRYGPQHTQHTASTAATPRYPQGRRQSPADAPTLLTPGTFIFFQFRVRQVRRGAARHVPARRTIYIYLLACPSISFSPGTFRSSNSKSAASPYTYTKSYNSNIYLLILNQIITIYMLSSYTYLSISSSLVLLGLPVPSPPRPRWRSMSPTSSPSPRPRSTATSRARTPSGRAGAACGLVVMVIAVCVGWRMSAALSRSSSRERQTLCSSWRTTPFRTRVRPRFVCYLYL